MKTQLLVLLTFTITLISACGTTDTTEEINLISKEHAAVFGTWEQSDSVNVVTWKFDQYEVKRNDFTHFYEVFGDSLVISGMVYRIREQSEEKMKILTPNGKECVLKKLD